jgi:putative secretion ATPase (PEP-CTERM system associated)
MYDQFYGLSGRPFQLTPDPHFYFESGTHRKAMSYLGYGLAQGEGFIVITGDIGAGKTTLVGHLMNSIDPNRLTAVKLVSTAVSGDALLQLVAEQFGLDWNGKGKGELLHDIEQFLREEARAGRRTLLIVDEGQNLPIAALEELRMLSNFQLGGHSLLQIFLLGQPEFRATLFQSPTLEQLRQRVIATHHLDPMEPEEVEPYILHRLKKVGWDGNPSFSPDAIDLLYEHSEGVPRRLNVLVSRVMLYGAVEQLHRLTAQHVRTVVAEMSADGGFAQARPIAMPADVIAMAAADESELMLDQPAPLEDSSAVLRFTPMAQDPDVTPAAPLPTTEFALARSMVAEQLSGGAEERVSQASAVDTETVTALQQQIANLEARLTEQDNALRRVLDLLIEWVERDPVGAPAAREWAA